MRSSTLFLIVVLLVSHQASLNGQGGTYELTLLEVGEGCISPCTCPLIHEGSGAGSFELVFLGTTGAIELYEVLGFSWTVSGPSGAQDLIGSGTYQIDLAAGWHEMVLQVTWQGATLTLQNHQSTTLAPGASIAEIAVSLSSAPECMATVVDLVAAPPTISPTSTFVRADCNADGSRNLADAVALLSVLFLSGAAPCMNACDTNDDEQFNISDAVHLLNGLFGGGGTPAAPFPGCGADPTVGAIPCGTFAVCP
ncbi:MAG: hypothetical protein AB7O52_04185 [Planctomycetota bacterium]